MLSNFPLVGYEQYLYSADILFIFVQKRHCYHKNQSEEQKYVVLINFGPVFVCQKSSIVAYFCRFLRNWAYRTPNVFLIIQQNILLMPK